MSKNPAAIRGRPATIAAPRETILVHAAQLFANKGYEGTSLQDIAKAVGISKAAVYHYFPSKNEIFEVIVSGLLQRLYEHVKADIEKTDGFAERLQQVMVSHAVFFEANYTDFITLLHGFGGLSREVGAMEVSARDRYEAMVRDLITAGHRAGSFQISDPAVATRAVLSMLNWMSRWYRPQGAIRARQFAEEYFELIYNGLRPR